jgi:two-component system, response regulator YesN
MDHRIKTIISLIHDDLRNSPSLEQMAEFVRLSPSRLNRIFKMETDVSFAQYVKSLRLRRARNLLETTFLNIKETMTNVGLNDLSHFVRDFKKAFGMTPSEYRNLQFQSLPKPAQFRNNKLSQRTRKLAKK